MRRPVFGVSDQVQNKLGCTATEYGARGLKFWRDYTVCVAKAKALISCSVSVPLFSHI